MKTNYVLIDFENVQPQQLTSLKAMSPKIKVFLGPTQTKIPKDFAKCLQDFGSDARYIEIEGVGPNALDFHIAFYIGELVASDSTGNFHIISKDTGFDPLIRHLQSRRITIRRYSDVTQIPLLGASPEKGAEERIAFLLDKLGKMKSNFPTTSQTLQNHINGLFAKRLSEPELSRLIDELFSRKVVALVEGKLVYNSPGTPIKPEVMSGKKAAPAPKASP
jgi:hypothetical protein